MNLRSRLRAVERKAASVRPGSRVESAIDRIERYMATGGLPPIPKFEEAFANAARREDPELYAKVNDVEMTVA